LHLRRAQLGLKCRQTIKWHQSSTLQPLSTA
jgi:hypothetical protein